jgi:hypothetical protein
MATVSCCGSELVTVSVAVTFFFRFFGLNETWTVRLAPGSSTAAPPPLTTANGVFRAPTSSDSRSVALTFFSAARHYRHQIL